MSLLADALQPYFVRELTQVSGRLGMMTLPDTLIAPQAAYRLSFDDASESIIADFGDATPVATAIAADACRLACASFQSMSLAGAELSARDSSAWSIIKLYYSAFYAGNAIVRILGESCSYFDAQHVLKINQTASALHLVPQFAINGGLYRCELIQADTAFRCSKIRGGSGGAHEAFWNVFGARVKAVSEGILKGPLVAADAQSVFAQLEALRRMLGRNSNHSWLSGVRNAVQYRHEHGVWYPRQLRARDREVLSRKVIRWIDDPMEIRFGLGKDALDEFVVCCCFVVSLCHVLLARIAERSPVGSRSFVHLGPMAFLNDISANPG